MSSSRGRVLALGIGNVLMGDEGVGVHVVQALARRDLPEHVECLDGGTGGFVLLDPMQRADHVVLIDATLDGRPPGTITRLMPKFAADYPATLTAHDIGLKDLLDAAYLAGQPMRVTLFAISINPLQGLSTELSPEIAAQVSRIVDLVLEEVVVPPRLAIAI